MWDILFFPSCPWNSNPIPSLFLKPTIGSSRPSSSGMNSPCVYPTWVHLEWLFIWIPLTFITQGNYIEAQWHWCLSWSCIPLTSMKTFFQQTPPFSLMATQSKNPPVYETIDFIILFSSKLTASCKSPFSLYSPPLTSMTTIFKQTPPFSLMETKYETPLVYATINVIILFSSKLTTFCKSPLYVYSPHLISMAKGFSPPYTMIFIFFSTTFSFSASPHELMLLL